MSGNDICKNPSEQNSNGSKKSDNLNSNVGKDASDELALVRKLRISMLVVLIFFFYALLAVSSTTDMMLLREGVIALPIIQVSVLVVEFYRWAPLILVLLHLHLLAILALYSRKICNSSGTTEISSKALGRFGKILIALFSFEQKNFITEMKNRDCVGFSVRIIFIIIFALIPLIILLVMQARFLPYQNDGFTLYHQYLISIDILIQAKIMCIFYDHIMDRKKPLRYLHITSFCFVFVLLPLFYVWTVPRVLGSDIENEVKSDRKQTIAGCFLKDWLKNENIVNSDAKQQIRECFLPGWLKKPDGERFINIQSKIITLRNPPHEVVGATIQMENKPAPKIHCEHVGMFDLSGRRLNFANFSGSNFYCVTMEDAQLDNSMLFHASFSTVSFTRASLKGADLSYADLGGINLAQAKLDMAILIDANLKGANLKGVSLSKANLRGVYLNDTDLTDVDLAKANLRWADLSGANLRWTKLTGAHLGEAILIEADLSYADLSGADLSGADLTGANLVGAKLYGARLYKADLRDIIIDEATSLYGANFSGSTPRHINLGKVYVKRPGIWIDILDDIKRDLREAGYLEREIDARLAKIERSAASTLGYVLPTGIDHCDLYLKSVYQESLPECPKDKTSE